MIHKCGVLLNIWVAERVVTEDESLHLQPSTRRNRRFENAGGQPNRPLVSILLSRDRPGLRAKGLAKTARASDGNRTKCTPPLPR